MIQGSTTRVLQEHKRQIGGQGSLERSNSRKLLMPVKGMGVGCKGQVMSPELRFWGCPTGIGPRGEQKELEPRRRCSHATAAAPNREGMKHPDFFLYQCFLLAELMRHSANETFRTTEM